MLEENRKWLDPRHFFLRPQLLYFRSEYSATNIARVLWQFVIQFREAHIVANCSNFCLL